MHKMMTSLPMARLRRPALLLFTAIVLPALLPGGTAAQETEPGNRASVRVEHDDGDLTVTGDRTIEEGEAVDDIVVAGGDLRVRGQIRGDALVFGGDLILEESGRINGDAVVAGGKIIENGGRVGGEMLVVDDFSALARLGGSADRKRDLDPEIESAVEHAVRVHTEVAERHEPSRWDVIQRRFALIFSTLAFALVLAGIGAALIFYGRTYLETVSDTIRASTLRAGATGLAAGFLIIPAFVVLIVALVVSIVGIPVLLVAIPLYPVAVFAAAVLGLLAAAHALGERTAEQQRDRIELRYTNSYAYLFTGLAMLFAPLIAADLIGMTGFLGWVSDLLKFVVFVVIWAATTIGLGAVILSRAGTRRGFTARPPDPLLDVDPLIDEHTDLR